MFFFSFAPSLDLHQSKKKKNALDGPVLLPLIRSKAGWYLSCSWSVPEENTSYHSSSYSEPNLNYGRCIWCTLSLPSWQLYGTHYPLCGHGCEWRTCGGFYVLPVAPSLTTFNVLSDTHPHILQVPGVLGSTQGPLTTGMPVLLWGWGCRL